MYRQRTVNGIHLRRILTHVIHRLNELSSDDTIDAIRLIEDSDYEPSDEELELIDLNEGCIDVLSDSERHMLTHYVVKKVDSNTVECPICLDNLMFRQHARILPCSHTFHKKCIDTWLKKDRRCPFCRSDVAQKAPPVIRQRIGTRSQSAS